MDITLRSVLTRAGEPQCNAADIDGAVLINARRDKEAKHPELAATGRCKIVVGGIETGGWWSEGCGLLEATINLQGTGGPKFHAKIRVLGAQMDSDVVCRVPTAFTASQVEPARHCESICWTGGDAPPLADLLWQDHRR